MRVVISALLSLFVFAASATQGGVQAGELPCHGDQQPKQVAELLFGRYIDHRLGVSESAWLRFMAREVTPRFPDGLTVTDAKGQWRNPATGEIVREPSERVEIVLPGHADDDTRIEAIVDAYKRAFRQHSVGVIIRGACVSF
jgi:hypothetical protein